MKEEWPWFRTRTGRWFPLIAGGSGDEGEAVPDPPPTEKTFTQAEVNAMMTREKNEGRTAAVNQIAEDLGVPVDEAKKIIEQHQKHEESQKTEAERAREAAEAEQAGAEQARREADRERHETRVERLLLRAGVEDADENSRLARVARMVTTPVGAEDDVLQAEVAQLKTDFPALFESTSDNQKPKAPAGDPPGSPPRPKQDKKAYDRGQERARARFGREPATP